MIDKIVKTDVPGLCKDLSSGGLLNTNMDALIQYKKRKAHKNRFKELERKIEIIENKLNQLGIL
jgi:hypothetical protein